MFRNEAEFSRYLMKKFKEQGIFATRIESHSTSVGIPDILACCNGRPVFVELKVIDKIKDMSVVTIPWRPGQQVFYTEYRLHTGMYVVTLSYVKEDDAIMIISCSKVFKDNKIGPDDFKYLFKHDWSKLDWSEQLIFAS